MLRVDSPGGSAVASDSIAAAVRRVRLAGQESCESDSECGTLMSFLSRRFAQRVQVCIAASSSVNHLCQPFIVVVTYALAGKPVVCSMGDLAASGGYMIAAACDTIVAQPTTITGSIGVIAAKLSVQR